MTTTATYYSLVATTTRLPTKKKRHFFRRQATTSTLSTPSALATFPSNILSSACSREAGPATLTSAATQSQVVTVSTTSTTTSVSTYVSIIVQTVVTMNTITAGVRTAAASTTTVNTTVVSTTTISVRSAAPSGNIYYMQITPDNNPVAQYALSDPQGHLSDYYYYQYRREVFILTDDGVLYSVTNNSYYYLPKYYIGQPSGKVYWQYATSYANHSWYGVPTTDGTGRVALYFNATQANSPNPYNFCICNLLSADSNAATGYHIYFWNVSTQVSNCDLTQLYLSPVNRG